mmetsp:Transcript_18699/g.37827  ORF Transcript_18699/g.37827 Transcript_18699/m.37827 type:complete len:349 (+) Transcript_18699:63-1109(+)
MPQEHSNAHTISKLLNQNIEKFLSFSSESIYSLLQLILPASISFPVRSKTLLGQRKIWIRAGSSIGTRFTLLFDNITGHGAQRIQQRRRNGHFIHSCQRQNLIDITPRYPYTSRRTPRRRHANCIVSELAKISVHSLYCQNSRIGIGSVTLFSTLLLMPIQYSPRKGRNEIRTSLSSCRRLQKAKYQGDIALNSLLLQNPCRLNSLPSPGQLDQNPLPAHPHFLIHGNDRPGPPHTPFGIVTQSNIHLGRNPPGNERNELLSQIHRQTVHRHLQRILGHGAPILRTRLGLCVAHRLLHHGLVAGIAIGSSLGDEEGIGGGVGEEASGGVAGDGVDVAGVDAQGGEVGE